MASLRVEEELSIHSRSIYINSVRLVWRPGLRQVPREKFFLLGVIRSNNTLNGEHGNSRQNIPTAR